MSAVLALRGEIWEINLNPRKRREQRGIRPCLVVSTNGTNRSRFGTIIVCPITTTERRNFTWRAKFVPGDLRVTDSTWSAEPHWVETDQIIPVDVGERVIRQLAVVVNSKTMGEVDAWLRRLLLPGGE